VLIRTLLSNSKRGAFLTIQSHASWPQRREASQASHRRQEPGRQILDGDTGQVPGAPDRFVYKVLIKQYSILNICFDELDRAVIQSFLSWKEATHDLVWAGVLQAYKQYRPHFIRLGMADAVPLEELQMPQLPVWMVTLLTPNLGILHTFPNPQQLIETLNNLEVSVAWTVLVDYADVND
jgi:hypothetical protein